uniref:type I polyketide synthase n=1 Tax=Nocardia carnea TaxID=37328 RepID=UPI002456CDA4
PPRPGVETYMAGLSANLPEPGYASGPASRGGGGVWRRGERWFAEVTLADSVDDDRFGIHPALFDAVVHARVLATGGADTEVLLPFIWEGTRLRATGARHVRVRGGPSGPAGGVTIEAFDAAGRPVVSVRRLIARPPAPGTGGPGSSGSVPALEVVRHVRVPAAATARDRSVRVLDVAGALAAITEPADPPDLLVVECADTADESGVPTAVAGMLDATLELLQGFLGTGRLDGTRLVVLTRGLAGGAVRGLVRSAQAEEPGRITLVDIEGDIDGAALSGLVDWDEPEIILRHGAVSVPRLRPIVPPDRAEADGADTADSGSVVSGGPLRPEGTVLITGGTGGLGAVLARHLVTEHGVRRLVLATRRGRAAPGAPELHTELTGLGARVDIVACDITDRAALDELLRGIPAEHPLTGVVHAAGVIDDGVLSGLDPARMRYVVEPKVKGAWYLHELTRDRNPAWFVLFSSVAGVLGTAGQGNYAAANAFLDSLAAFRRDRGLPAVSIDWGLWAAESGMAGTLGTADTARIGRSGLRPLSTTAGLALFDAAVMGAESAVVAADFDRAALRSAARGRRLAPILTDLAGIRPTAAPAPAVTLDLAGLTEEQQRKRLLDTVRSQIAEVLGHRGPDRIDPEANFRDLGFDSLAGVELRNSLGAVTGLRLPATAVFDHPTPAAVAAYLHRQVRGTGPEAVFGELQRLESRLSAMDPGDEAVRQVLARLEGLTRTCRELSAAAAAAGGDDDLRTASPEELVEMIEQEFGKS